MQYLIINNPEEFTGNIGNNKAIIPIKIKTPDAYILPYRVLQDEDIINTFPELMNCKLLDSENIEFIKIENII